MYINYNGRIIGQQDFFIAAQNRSFLYGDGLFETIKIFRGKALFFNQHYVRFIEGLDTLQMELPEHWSVPFFKKQVEELAEKNAQTHARVRLTFWRSEGGFYTPENNTAEYIIQSFPLETEFYTINSAGNTLGIFNDIPKNANALAAYKTANALPYIMGGLYARQQQLDDVVILNTAGRPVETLHSNIFIVHEKKMITPEVSEGCVNGVMRRVLIKMCRQMQIDVVESKISVDDILAADSVFTTNTIQGIQWVGQFGKSIYDQGIAAMLLARINEQLMDSSV